jgi:Ser/Thr protein kinase RdoA (MazF antagonist)
MTVRQPTAVDEALLRASSLWGLEKNSFTLLRDGQNHVFSARRDDGHKAGGQKVIVRVTDDSHRSAALIDGELSWLAFLSAHGCAVSNPLPASDDSLLTTLAVGGEQVHVVCFTYLDGSQVDPGDPRQWTPDLFAELGRELGRIHAVSADFKPDPGSRRYAWDEETEYRRLPDGFRDLVPDAVLDAIEGMFARLRNQSKQPGTFGLIHSDVYADNFFYGDGQVRLFDFDQACYGWYVYDLICPLYPHYISPVAKIPGATSADAAAFFGHLVAGYRETHVLTAEQLGLAGELLRLKEIFVYLILVEKFDQWAATLDTSPETLRHMLDTVERRLIAGAPVLDVDFTGY